MNERIYIKNVVSILQNLADIQYQEDVWLNKNNPKKLADSFIEAANMLFDDCVIGDYLAQGEIIISKSITRAFIELKRAIDAIDEFRAEEDIIQDPLMDLVRAKAAEILHLIATTDGSESTVELV